MYSLWGTLPHDPMNSVMSATICANKETIKHVEIPTCTVLFCDFFNIIEAELTSVAGPLCHNTNQDLDML